MTQEPAASSWSDPVRLALGTLTVLPVAPPRTVDRRTAGRAMLLAPLVGALLGLLAGVVLFLGRRVYHEPYLPSALAIATLALATRALHLDGLADTADGLGVGVHRGRERALAVMRAGDVGPFGVVTVVLLLLVQVTALSDAVLHGLGTESVIGAAIIGRLAATQACLRGVPAARRDGLGATVAGSVGWLGATVATAAVLAGGLLEGGVLDDDAGTRPAVLAGFAVVAGLVAGWLVVLVARRRFGGVTGDVLGAVVEIATTAALLVLAAWPWAQFPADPSRHGVSRWVAIALSAVARTTEAAMNPTHPDSGSRRGQVTLSRRRGARREDEVLDEQLSTDASPTSVTRTWHWRHGLDPVRTSA